jgi:hypothetical protein
MAMSIYEPRNDRTALQIHNVSSGRNVKFIRGRDPHDPSIANQEYSVWDYIGTRTVPNTGAHDGCQSTYIGVVR